MQLEGNGGTREPFKPPPPRLAPWMTSLQDFFHPATTDRAPFALHPSTPQPQQYSLVTPDRPSLIDWTPGNDPFSQQQKPVSTQLSKEPPASVASGHPPVSALLINQQQEAEPKVFDQNVENAKFDELFAKRKAYEKADKTDTAKELTPQQWATLSPMQQAAAQSNFDLAAAVKKDFDSQGKNKSDETQRKTYNDSVEKIFGGAEFLNYKGMNFAPNTVAFLDSRGIKEADMAGRTLDDFLSGSALVSTETFKAMEEPVKPLDTGRPDARGNNIQFAQTLAKGQLAYQEGLALKLKAGDRLITDITSTSTNTLANKTYGALQTPAQQINITDVRPETAAQFDKYMEVLARPDFDINLALDTIKQDLQERKVSTKESAQVWDSLIERVHQASTGEGKWFEGVGTQMRSPGEVAQVLGVPTLKRRATPGTGPKATTGTIPQTTPRAY